MLSGDKRQNCGVLSHHSNNETNLLPTIQVHNLLTNTVVNVFLFTKKTFKNSFYFNFVLKTLKNVFFTSMVSTNEHIALFDIVVFFEPHRRYKIPMGTSLAGR